MKFDYIDSLNDISRSIQLTQEFTSGMTFDEFQSDAKTLYAVIRCIAVIEKAVKWLPDDFQENISRYSLESHGGCVGQAHSW